MTERRSKQISSRKQPQQARSAELVSAILTAAIQVLAQEGAARFTTARVAERAGVSRGAAQHHFPTREKLITATLEQVFDEVEAHVVAFDNFLTGGVSSNTVYVAI